MSGVFKEALFFINVILALIIPFFTSKGYDVFYNHTKTLDVRPIGYCNKKDTECLANEKKYQDIEKNYQDIENHKLKVMLVIGLIYTIIGSILSKIVNIDTFLSILASGLILIIYNIIFNWRRFTNPIQLIIMGIIIIVFLIISIYGANYIAHKYEST